MCFLTDHNTTSCWWHARRSPPSSSHLLQSTGFTEISLYRNDENQAEPSCGVLNRLWACLILLSHNINFYPMSQAHGRKMKLNESSCWNVLWSDILIPHHVADFFHSKTRCCPMVNGHVTFDNEGFSSIRAACACSTAVSWIEQRDELEGMWGMLCHTREKRKSCSSSTLTRKKYDRIWGLAKKPFFPPYLASK